MNKKFGAVLLYGFLLAFLGCSLAIFWRSGKESWGTESGYSFWSSEFFPSVVLDYHSVPRVLLPKASIDVVSSGKERELFLATHGRDPVEKELLEKRFETVTQDMVGQQMIAVARMGLSPGLILAWLISLQGIVGVLCFKIGRRKRDREDREVRPEIRSNPHLQCGP